MGTNQKAIQMSRDMSQAHSFVTPGVSAILGFNIGKAPLNDKIFEPFTEGVLYLGSSSVLGR